MIPACIGKSKSTRLVSNQARPGSGAPTEKNVTAWTGAAIATAATISDASSLIIQVSPSAVSTACCAILVPNDALYYCGVILSTYQRCVNSSVRAAQSYPAPPESNINEKCRGTLQSVYFRSASATN